MTWVGAQLPAVANPAVAPPLTTVAAEVLTNLSTSASTRPSPTAILSATAYLPPARCPYADLRPIHSFNLNVNRSQTEGTLRTWATVVSMATIGNPPSTLNPHVTMNTRVGDNNNQGAQRSIMQHYSTELEMQQVIKLSAVDEEIQRLQAKRSALAVGIADLSATTSNPNLSGLKSATPNLFAQPFVSTVPLPIIQPWTMLEYAKLPKIPLFRVPGGQLMACTNN